MTGMIYTSDIVPVSEAQAKLPQLIKDIRGTERPIVVTAGGRPIAVLLDVNGYERFADLASLGIDALKRLGKEAEGKTVPWEQIKRELEAR